MDYETLRGALLSMAADQLGYYHCQGCGCEHNCQQEGCAILREAIATMEQPYKDCEGDCTCCAHSGIPCDKPPCADCFDTRNNYHTRNWQWRGVQQKEARSNGKTD